MRVTRSNLSGVCSIEPVVHRDARGFFAETYQAERYREAGITAVFVQDNHTRSLVGTIRGLHMQLRNAQAKLLRVVSGEIFDVAVDLRRGSPTFGQWDSQYLSAANFKQFYIPEGFAHGFCVLSDVAEVEYKCSAYYDPADEIVVAWNDPTLAIVWPIAAPILSGRDRQGPTLESVMDRLPRFHDVIA